RYTGIFNQPMEAGVMYSIGLLTWLYLIEKVKKIKIIHILPLFLLVISGLLSVSKIFIFGGLALFFVGVFFNKNIYKIIFKLTFITLILGWIAYHFLIKSWSGLNYLLRFFQGNENMIHLLTAGRFGSENSQQSGLFSRVWEQSPLFGFGLGVNEVYDSGFYQVFAVSGIIGFSIFIFLLLKMVSKALAFFSVNNFNA